MLGRPEDQRLGFGNAIREMTMDKPLKAPLVRLTVIALLVAAAGIVMQILSGADYPVVPPGIIILLVAAGLVWFGPWRWTPIVGALAALSQFIGLFAAGQAPRLFALDPLGDSVGLWIQLLAVTVAVVAGVAAVVRDDRGRASVE
jgi:hypothetical protein